MIRRDDLLGAWRLATYTAESGGDVAEPLGLEPVGIIVYTPDGYMSAQLMRPDRPAYDKAITGGGTPEQLADAARGYLCYSGPFSVDESADVVHHHVEVSLLPNWVGGVQVRRAHLDGETLTLSAEVTSRKGVSSTHVLVWRRAQPR
ncbi:lipocalin-like domain-containing protein [Mycolicibacterium hodleri]|uniref:Lipocalin-like domain-containing protein n=1 Tax=Mycolicibacterium hodleri TaxID=49897 RepID=A0A502DJY8_9MYCO|nr:lipocalin-like domain-containing protein [Mycolicibacterium hodleri]TPG25533.1 lipocalin-like domain-containing protein [Mycolicibacterium hodleri]